MSDLINHRQTNSMSALTDAAAAVDAALNDINAALQTDQSGGTVQQYGAAFNTALRTIFAPGATSASSEMLLKSGVRIDAIGVSSAVLPVGDRPDAVKVLGSLLNGLERIERTAPHRRRSHAINHPRARPAARQATRCRSGSSPHSRTAEGA